jgi:predicted transcriptional regulator
MESKLESATLLMELTAIKKLMIVALLKDGASQAEIAQVLGISQPTVSRMVPGIVRKKGSEANG